MIKIGINNEHVTVMIICTRNNMGFSIYKVKKKRFQEVETNPFTPLSYCSTLLRI